VREAADFCRYYAHLAETRFAGPETLKGPVGETNTLELRGRGVFACISPWNFPLAIFTGQVAAALAAGNAVVAKPAEQTPLIAAEAVAPLSRRRARPGPAALTPGRRRDGRAALVTHPLCAGVAFTGGTDTAAPSIARIAGRPGPSFPSSPRPAG
jgi:RHH-type proline utilization regulon transcriptional repressor/proline dehydrogenase/delta 1-pyrroline-5-carboxylate dehydrogenase